MEILDVQPTDLILDPTCGTGGFLVDTFDEVKKKCKDDKEYDNFSKYYIFLNQLIMYKTSCIIIFI